MVLSFNNNLTMDRQIRVAAYCRVSTGDESQQTSYANQMNYYRNLIERNSDYILVKVYADEGISGTSRTKRVEFNTMITDALNGRIDFIVTKSISRFARNTVDTLNCVRQLRQLPNPVGIYFEKENINTLDAGSELLLTILSALAQEESRSISTNIKWALQKNFQNGKPQINLNRMLGYKKGENGSWVIIPEEAKIVRFIFNEHIKGESANQIARLANQRHMKTINNNNWTPCAILTVLRNEKYVGDLEMQKTITIDFLTHKSIRNKGHLPKYYVKSHHPAIIDRDTWNKSNLLLHNSDCCTTRTKTNQFNNISCYYNSAEINKVQEFSRMIYSRSAKDYPKNSDEISHYSYYYSFAVWKCNKCCSLCERYSSCKVYENGLLYEFTLKQSFMEMIHNIKESLHKTGSILRASVEKDIDKVTLKEEFERFTYYIEETATISPNIESTTDLTYGKFIIPFEKFIYDTFIESGIIKDDTITYKTTFGLTFISTGNSRCLEDFEGYAVTDKTGIKHTIEQPWELMEYKIQKHRKK